MEIISVRNVHEALPEALDRLEQKGYRRKSRNGSVIMFDGPVTTKYSAPMERVIFWPQRDANPFFHLFESLWMLAGRDDVAFVKQFVKRMETFSDDGVRFHAAYGHRWRNHFPKDQLPLIIDALAKDPDNRRAVLAMWDAPFDLGHSGKDFPCNTHVYFSIGRTGKLDMTVSNRSNDMVWGAYGANAVHLSVLQEYVARGIDREVGTYWQVSNNLHAYEATLATVAELVIHAGDPFRRIERNPYYGTMNVHMTPVVDLPLKQWDRELALFLEAPQSVGCDSKFFNRIAKPMWFAHKAVKSGGIERYTTALEILEQMPPRSDWRVAAVDWINRRIMKQAHAL